MDPKAYPLAAFQLAAFKLTLWVLVQLLAAAPERFAQLPVVRGSPVALELALVRGSLAVALAEPLLLGLWGCLPCRPCQFRFSSECVLSGGAIVVVFASWVFCDCHHAPYRIPLFDFDP